MIKISIIIPVYKTEQYIERCVRSLMEQTMKEHIEFIFINDCTPDKSMIILRKVIHEYPNRKEQIRIIENESNLGISKVRKLGVKIAKGEYIGWCDSDDWVEPTMYEDMYNASNNGYIDNIICNYWYESNNKTHEITFKICNTPQECIINSWKGYYFPGSLWQQINKRVHILECINKIVNTNNSEDIYTLMLVYHYSRSINYINKPLYHHICDNSSSLLNNKCTNYTEWIKQKQNIKIITQILYSSKGEKTYHVTCNALKFTKKNEYRSAFKNILSFYFTFHECYRDINIYSFTPQKQKLKTYLTFNFLPFFLIYHFKTLISTKFPNLLKTFLSL